MAGRPLAPDPPGAHFLRDRRLISAPARASGAALGRLALDLGSGGGAITARLAAAGARVIAVERPRLAARLRRRFAGSPRCAETEADRWLRHRDATAADLRPAKGPRTCLDRPGAVARSV